MGLFQSSQSVDCRGWRPEMGIRTRVDLSHEICMSRRAFVWHPSAFLIPLLFHSVFTRELCRSVPVVGEVIATPEARLTLCTPPFL